MLSFKKSTAAWPIFFLLVILLMKASTSIFVLAKDYEEGEKLAAKDKFEDAKVRLRDLIDSLGDMYQDVKEKTEKKDEGSAKMRIEDIVESLKAHSKESHKGKFTQWFENFRSMFKGTREDFEAAKVKLNDMINDMNIDDSRKVEAKSKVSEILDRFFATSTKTNENDKLNEMKDELHNLFNWLEGGRWSGYYQASKEKIYDLFEGVKNMFTSDKEPNKSLYEDLKKKFYRMIDEMNTEGITDYPRFAEAKLRINRILDDFYNNPNKRDKINELKDQLEGVIRNLEERGEKSTLSSIYDSIIKMFRRGGDLKGSLYDQSQQMVYSMFDQLKYSYEKLKDKMSPAESFSDFKFKIYDFFDYLNQKAMESKDYNKENYDLAKKKLNELIEKYESSKDYSIDKLNELKNKAWEIFHHLGLKREGADERSLAFEDLKHELGDIVEKFRETEGRSRNQDALKKKLQESLDKIFKKEYIDEHKFNMEKQRLNDLVDEFYKAKDFSVSKYDEFVFKLGQVVDDLKTFKFEVRERQPEEVYDELKRFLFHMIDNKDKYSKKEFEETKGKLLVMLDKIHPDKVREIERERRDKSYSKRFYDSSKDSFSNLLDSMKSKYHDSKELTKEKYDELKKSYNDIIDSLEAAPEEAKEATQQRYEKAKENLSNLFNKMGDKGSEFYKSNQRKFGDMFDSLRDSVAGGYYYTKEKVGGAYDYAKDKAGEAKDKVGGAYDYVKDKAADTADYAKEKVGGAYDYAKDKAGEAKDKAGGAYDYVKDKAADTVDYTKEKVGGAYDYAKDKAGEAKDKVGGAYDYSKDKAKEGYEYVKDKAKDAQYTVSDKYTEQKEKAAEKLADSALKDRAERAKAEAKDKSKGTYEAINEKYENLKETVKEKWDEAKKKIKEQAQDL